MIVANSFSLKTVEMAFLGKQYTCYKNENFDTFLKHIGTPEDKIGVIIAAPSIQKFEKNGDSYKIITNSVEGTKETTFKSGVEFDDIIGLTKTPIKTTFVVDGNTVTQTVKTDKGTAVFKREFNGDELVVTITSDGWDSAAKRYYKV